MNVLVYNGHGTTPGSVKHAVETLRNFLEPYYAVSTVSEKVLETEPWTVKTSAIVFPGGADLPYVRDCKPVIPKIKDFVNKGGLYIGFCAGGYFGTSRVEFSQGDPNMEVTGNRDLKFFPGIGRGPAYGKYQYNSETGARACELELRDGSKVYNYYNGGAVFVDAGKMENTEVLATYSEPTHVPFTDDTQNNSDSKPAAVILCSIGKGKALLTGTHPEFTPNLLKKNDGNTELLKPIIQTLEEHEVERKTFFRFMLKKAGLNCNNDFSYVRAPSLTPIFMMAPSKPENILQFENNLVNDNLDRIIRNGNLVEMTDDTDKFNIYKGFEKSYDIANLPLHDQEPEEIAKAIILADDNEKLPPSRLTPNFDSKKYFNALNPTNSLGSTLLYGEVVTSTSTLLNTNKNILTALPENSVLHIGTIQVSGRGRGGNVWVNPKGIAAATAVISLPLTSPKTQKPVSIVFVQYISMLAYCKAINSYHDGFEDIPVRIKWPNDLYALSPKYYASRKMKLLGTGFNHNLVSLKVIEPAYVKISGLLVNTQFINNKYTLLLGCGLNVNIDGPTTSLNTWVDILNEEREAANLSLLPHVEIEILQARYMNELENLLSQFVDYGSNFILPDYYKFWLHSNQIVTLTSHGNVRCKITGITEDYGLLIAEELQQGSDDRFTGVIYNLQPDGNTFDIFNGLLAKKVI